MVEWTVEPLWATVDRLQMVHQLTAADTLVVGCADQALTPRPVRRGYRGLDRLKSRLAQGEKNIIVRLRG